MKFEILGSRITEDVYKRQVMCADHGVVAEGVTQTGKEVTRIVAENFTRGETSTSKMCRIAGTDLYPVDMGIDVYKRQIIKKWYR